MLKRDEFAVYKAGEDFKRTVKARDAYKVLANMGYEVDWKWRELDERLNKLSQYNYVIK